MRGVIEGGCQIVVVMHEVTEGRNLGMVKLGTIIIVFNVNITFDCICGHG